MNTYAEILDMELDRRGYTSLWPGHGMFPEWVRRKEWSIQTRVVDVIDGFVHWNNRLKLPVKPWRGSSASGRCTGPC